jgi:hypothetical protein
MEAIHLPIYIITYNIEMTQFAFAKATAYVTDPVDHSAASRKHAQFIANQIADEARINLVQLRDSPHLRSSNSSSSL